MARRLYGWRRGHRPRLPIRLKLNHPPLTRLDFFLFFFLILFAPFSSPFWRTHKDQVSWAFTVCLPCGREPFREYCITYTHTHIQYLASPWCRDTHTHHRWRLSISFPSGQHIQFTGGGGTYQQRRRLQFNYDNRRPDKTFVWTVHVGFSRQQGNVSSSSWMVYQINDFKNKTKQNKSITSGRHLKIRFFAPRKFKHLSGFQLQSQSFKPILEGGT